MSTGSAGHRGTPLLKVSERCRGRGAMRLFGHAHEGFPSRGKNLLRVSVASAPSDLQPMSALCRVLLATDVVHVIESTIIKGMIVAIRSV